VKTLAILLCIATGLVLICGFGLYWLFSPPSASGAQNAADAFLNDLGEGNIDAAFGRTALGSEVSLRLFRDYVNQHPALRTQRSRSIKVRGVFGRGIGIYHAIVDATVTGPHNSVSLVLDLGMGTLIAGGKTHDEWKVDGFSVRADLGLNDDAQQAAALEVADPMVLFEVYWGSQASSSAVPACFSPDGKTLACEMGQGVSLWKVATGKRLRDLPSSYFPFSPDSKLLPMGIVGGKMRFLNVETGQVEGPHVIPDGGPRAGLAYLSFSPDGKVLAGTFNGHVQVWDTKSGEPKQTPSHPGGRADFVEFLSDGQTVASASTNGIGCLWDVKTGALLQRFRLTSDLYGGSVYCAPCFSRDGKHAASADNGGPMLWDLPRGKEKFVLMKEQALRKGLPGPIGFSPDGKSLAAGVGEGLRLWDVDTGAMKWELTTVDALVGGSSSIESRGLSHSFAFSRDSRLLVMGGRKVWCLPRR
jgi:hypothetical protein